MYIPGNVIYFSPFYFPNGEPCKNKYFIVFYSEGESIIIAGLPTRTDHIPGFIEKKQGCINDNKIPFNCYFIPKDVIVTENGWSFPMDTHIYGDEVDFFIRERFEEIYKIEGVEYEVIGKLTKGEFSQMVDCFKNSNATKRGVRRKLGAII